MQHTPSRGFTLIELLTVIAIIGMLATILLVSVTGARDDAKEAAVLAQVKSAQIAISRCLFKNKVMYCRYPSFTWSTYHGVGECGGGDASAIWYWGIPSEDGRRTSSFFSNTPLCGANMALYTDTGTGDSTMGYWPDVRKYGFRYGAYAGSNVNNGQFAFYVFQETSADKRVVFCCTQKGCSRSEKSVSAGELSFYNNDPTSFSQSNFCRTEAAGGGTFTES